jgi:RNA polymerase sigma-70 factor (ECF subfamily)
MSDEILKTLDLVRAAQGGSRAALDDLIARYYPRVLKIVRLRMGEKLRERLDSGDILHETFLAAVKSFERFEMRDEASLINWLSRIAQRRVLSAAEHEGAAKRKSARETALEPSFDTSTSPVGMQPAADTMVPLDRAIRHEELAVVEECIEQLPEHYREVIVLRNYTGMSFAQIATETGRPTEGASRMLHAKAMIELAKLLRARGAEPQ